MENGGVRQPVEHPAELEISMFDFPKCLSLVTTDMELLIRPSKILPFVFSVGADNKRNMASNWHPDSSCIPYPCQ
jgi:hypothetical protein